MSFIVIQCLLCTDTDNRLVISEGSKLLGTNITPESQQNFDFYIPLDPYRLKEIENYRASGNLKLRLEIQIIAALPSNVTGNLQDSTTQAKFHVSEISSIFERINFEIPRSIWIERILPKLNKFNVELIEFPLGKGRLQEAYSFLEASEDAYNRWDTKSVYVHCREMATALDRIIRQRLASDKFSIDERWVRAYDKFNNLASLDLHLEDIKKSTAIDSQQVKIDRRDAEFVFLSAKLLLKYANELLPEDKFNKRPNPQLQATWLRIKE